jgi:alpha-tubulin suppressor-like RCC1 family protein
LSTPYLIEGVSDIVDVSLGGAHTCALDGAGDVWCWGHNGAGQCGNGSAAPITLTPTRFDVPFDVARLFAAHNRTCVQTALGEAYCAGWNGRGEILGRPEGPSILTPVRAADLDGAESIVGGYEHVCALIQGRVWCRGRGDNGSLGDGTFLASSTLVAAVGLTGVSEIVAGNYHSCALVGGTLRCWGLADGYGVSRNSGVPVQVPGLP